MEAAMVRRDGSERRRRLQELSCSGGRRTADGGRRTADGIFRVDRYCCRHPLSSVVNDVFDGSSAPSSSDRGCCRRGLVISLPPLSLRSGAPPDPNGNNDKDNDKDDNKGDGHSRRGGGGEVDRRPPVRRRGGRVQ